MALGVEQKLLPTSIIADVARGYVTQWEEAHGVKAGRKLQRDFRDRATTELLPRALARRRVIRVWIDAPRHRLICDAASPTMAEHATEVLRDDLGELALSLPTTDHAPADTLSTWLRSNQLPIGFALGEECELAGADAARPTLRYQRHPLPTAELHQHLDDGFRVSRLGLVWKDRLSFVIDARLQLKKLRFLDIDEVADEAQATPQERFDAEMALMITSCSALLDELLAALQIMPYTS